MSNLLCVSGKNESSCGVLPSELRTVLSVKQKFNEKPISLSMKFSLESIVVQNAPELPAA